MYSEKHMHSAGCYIGDLAWLHHWRLTCRVGSLGGCSTWCLYHLPTYYCIGVGDRGVCSLKC